MKDRKAKIIFITGTDTGVGKTVLTAMLVYYLRKEGIHALAIKPFCSGGFEDVDLLRAGQGNELSRSEISPFYFSKAAAPLAAVKNKNQLPSLSKVLGKISEIARKCDVLLIEGAGGLMVPLNKNIFVVDLIKALRCEVIVVARNKLGTINHTLLSIAVLESGGLKGKIKVVLMDQMRKLDSSGSSNLAVLSNLAPGIVFFSVPFFGEKANKVSSLEKNCKKIENTLARLL